MEEQCICVRNLTKAFSGRVVVDDLSFFRRHHPGGGVSLLVPGYGKGDVMPMGIGIDLLKTVSLGCYDRVILPVLTLMAMTAVCGFVAVKTFRWE